MSGAVERRILRVDLTEELPGDGDPVDAVRERATHELLSKCGVATRPEAEGKVVPAH